MLLSPTHFFYSPNNITKKPRKTFFFLIRTFSMPSSVFLCWNWKFCSTDTRLVISSGNEPSTCMPNSQLFDGNYNSTNHREIPSSTEFFPQFSLLTFNKMCLISKYLCWYRNESVLLGQAEFFGNFFPLFSLLFMQRTTCACVRLADSLHT